MKKVLLALAMVALVSPVAFANDTDTADKAETTVDTSKNPLTGTVTTTKKTKKEVKRGKGHAKVEATEKTKQMTDGTTEKSVDVESDSKTN